ncbi:STAS domain-containing protein [Streptomyces sp. 21So2-11]|uniref:STAS domain-containing protein n=1 Tax=Streptomyces sp. 21So2-11 TaxID=3144408 RepID=UPI00321AA2E4
MTNPISVTMRPWEPVPVVALSGELDLATVGQVEPALVGLALDSGHDLVLDLAGLTFCDSTGAALFLRLDRRCADVGTRLRLRQVPRIPARVLRALGIDRSVTCSFS